MALWNDKRTPKGVYTDTHSGRQGFMQSGANYVEAHAAGMKPRIGPMQTAHDWMADQASKKASKLSSAQDGHGKLPKRNDPPGAGARRKK